MPRVCLELYMLKIQIAPRSLQNGNATITIMVYFNTVLQALFACKQALGMLCFRFKDSGMEEKMETWNNQEVAERIKYLREENKLTQSQVAQRLNYASRNTVSDYETGRRSVGVQVAVAYAELFGVSLDWILRGTGAYRKESKSETDELLSVFFSIRKPQVREIAIEQMRSLAKL